MTVFGKAGLGGAKASSHGRAKILRVGSRHPYLASIGASAIQWWVKLERQTGVSLHVATGVRYYALHGSEALAETVASLTRNERRHYVDPHSFHFGREYTCVVEPGGGLLIPSRCLEALDRRAREIGVRLEKGEVRSVTSAGESVELRIDQKSFCFDRVVVAAGPWISRLIPELQPKLRVTRQYPVWLAAEPIGDGTRQPWIDLDNGYYGVVNAEQGRHLIARHIGGAETELGYGSQGNGYDPDDPVDPEMQELAATDGIRTFTSMFKPLAGAQLVDVDVCHYTNTRSGQFIVDRSPGAPNIIILSACSGQGFKFAPVSGAHAATLADDLNLPAANEESLISSCPWSATEAS